MPDQADELRKLVAEKVIDCDFCADGWVDTDSDGLAPCPKCSSLRHGRRIHPVLGMVTIHSGLPTPDKAKLWDELKAELERDIDQFYVDRLKGGTATVKTHGDEHKSITGRTLLDRMLSMETLATYVRPATDATFARVAEDLRAKP